MERKEILKKLASYALTISLITGSSSLLSGCQKKGDSTINTYYVVFNNNNATIYDDSTCKISEGAYSGNAFICEGRKEIKITNYIRFKKYTKEEVEDKVRDLIGEDGTIIYYETENKTLKKVYK